MGVAPGAESQTADSARKLAKCVGSARRKGVPPLQRISPSGGAPTRSGSMSQGTCPGPRARSRQRTGTPALLRPTVLDRCSDHAERGRVERLQPPPGRPLRRGANKRHGSDSAARTDVVTAEPPVGRGGGGGRSCCPRPTGGRGHPSTLHMGGSNGSRSGGLAARVLGAERLTDVCLCEAVDGVGTTQPVEVREPLLPEGVVVMTHS